MNPRKTIIVFALFTISLIVFSESKLQELLPEIESIIEKGKQNIWA